MAAYDDAIRRRIRSRWEQYRGEAKTNQTKAAKAMGMNQSALGQYLRGDIPLNMDFIHKFAELTQTDFGEVKASVRPSVKAITLPVRGSLSGEVYDNRRRSVNSIIPTDDCFLIEIDYASHYLAKGTFIIASENDKCRAGDSIILIKGANHVVLGELNNTEDGWKITEYHFLGARNYSVSASDKLYRVVGSYLPERSGMHFST